MSAAVVPMMRQRSVVVVTPDALLRSRLEERLSTMRWHVLSAAGGAEAMNHLDAARPEAMIVDHWLPDLDAAEFAISAAALCPATDFLGVDGTSSSSGYRSARRHELLHVLREVQEESSSLSLANPPLSTDAALGLLPIVRRIEGDGAVWNSAPAVVPQAVNHVLPFEAAEASSSGPPSSSVAERPQVTMHLPELVGDAASMRELASMVRLAAPHAVSVLIQGETGTGKELVAKAVHRLSTRTGKPFAVLNCAAIPEHLLEAELFGHTRGAFTGAVTSRTGRIEAAHGGTLFLDEIGEMPLPLQAKMLRFLESGEIQRVGDNEVFRVDVRIVAATHQPLEEHAQKGLFRLDLFHRLAVFPVEVPALRDRAEDIPMLAEHFLQKLGETGPRRTLSADALAALCGAPWKGNVRELSHALQRAVILAGDGRRVTPAHLRLRAS